MLISSFHWALINTTRIQRPLKMLLGGLILPRLLPVTQNKMNQSNSVCFWIMTEINTV